MKMKMNFQIAWCLAAALAAFFIAGCSQSSDTAKDDAPLDIRGEPINSAPATAASPTPAAAQPAAASPIEPSLPPPSTAEVAPPKTGPPKEQTESTVETAKAESEKAGIDDYLSVNFDKLASFNFEIPDELPGTNQVATAQSKDQIPPDIKALDQRNVALKGFMLPLKVEAGLVTEMLIMRDQSMCCYGTVPKINEWVSIKMTEKGVKAIMDQPVTIFGKLSVGEMRENGYLVGIYAMEGERMVGPLDM